MKLSSQVPQPTCYFQKQVRRGTWLSIEQGWRRRQMKKLGRIIDNYLFFEIHFPCPEIHFPCLEIHFPCPEIHFPCLEIHFPFLKIHFPWPEIHFHLAHFITGAFSHTSRRWSGQRWLITIRATTYHQNTLQERVRPEEKFKKFKL